MSRGGSSGGGQSSLGYLFGSDPSSKANEESPKVVRPIDGLNSLSSPSEEKVSNNYHRADGPNSGNFITGRPSTKVQSVPGGGSSLGYLFGDKK